ncbi:hypothetical protein ACHAXA_006525 [Cyclostephanos tholiformis]|uniref:Uncharacterized protein n=1 Tax=Cyclostephanos tholiformis TaxID=382380 RepID=A0ABD3R625_9STRA
MSKISSEPLRHLQSAASWNDEFDRYKSFPEYGQRTSMTLDEFKYIYYWEWGHRMMGRFVGVVFGGGWAYYTWLHRPKLHTAMSAAISSSSSSSSSSSMATSILLPRNALSAIPPGYQSRLALLFAMGGAQGLVGWWMVKSGLGDDRRDDRHEIRVSPYRLAAHLGMAVGTYSMLLWTGLGALSYPVDRYASIAPVVETTTMATAADRFAPSMLRRYAANLSPDALRHARVTRAGVMTTVGLTGLTILSGAFVAGNDAGNAYNTYPLMDGRWIPWDDMLDPGKVPIWRNAFETTATVQWNHRVLGTCTALSALGAAGYGLLACNRGGRGTTPQVRRGLVAMGAAATGQMSLGIATLLNYVPIALAASHQLGSLVVLTCGVYTAHSLRYAGKGAAMKVGGEAVQSLAGGSSGGRLMQKSAAVMSRMSNMKI